MKENRTKRFVISLAVIMISIRFVMTSAVLLTGVMGEYIATVTAGVLGLLFSLVIAYLITSILVKKSNDVGNSKGEFEDFSSHDITVLEKLDNGKQKDYESLVEMSQAAGLPVRWIQIQDKRDDLSGDVL